MRAVSDSTARMQAGAAALHRVRASWLRGSILHRAAPRLRGARGRRSPSSSRVALLRCWMASAPTSGAPSRTSPTPKASAAPRRACGAGARRRASARAMPPASRAPDPLRARWEPRPRAAARARRVEAAARPAPEGRAHLATRGRQTRRGPSCVRGHGRPPQRRQCARRRATEETATAASSRIWPPRTAARLAPTSRCLWPSPRRACAKAPAPARPPLQPPRLASPPCATAARGSAHGAPTGTTARASPSHRRLAPYRARCMLAAPCPRPAQRSADVPRRLRT